MGIHEGLGRLSNWLGFLLMCGLFGMISCEQRVEGCLDFRALDVDLNADDACSDCCVFPSLALNFVPVRLDGGVVSDILQRSDTLMLGSELGLSPELGFYLHDIALISDDGQRLEMQDTFTVFSGGEEPDFVFERSLLRITPFSQTSYELGTLLEAQTFIAIEAKLGLPDVLRSVEIDFQPVGSPLSRNADSLLISAQGDKFLDVNFRYVRQDGNPDSSTVGEAQSQLVRWDLPNPFAFEPSFNFIISLGIPADLLLSLDNGTVNGDVFISDFLNQSEILETFLSRS